MIKAILFDIDGVLVDSVKANARFYRDVLGHFGFPGPTDAEQAKHNHRTFIDNIRLYAPGASEELIRKIFDYGVALPHSHDMLELMDGVKETLEQLEKQYALGVVSSRLHASIGSLLEYFSLNQLFPVRVGFEDTEEHKPHPAPLLFGAKKLGLPVSQVVYVGDAATDIEAAKAADMRMILYAAQPLPGPDVTIGKFSELPKFLQSLDVNGLLK
ncbi:MAG: HAD family hydrolase [Candidatus Kerfeldbacteria bacterium]|nr:HAD family hydrolase [Candidatus Kerfeldbacteria bacterium]